MLCCAPAAAPRRAPSSLRSELQRTPCEHAAAGCVPPLPWQLHVAGTHQAVQCNSLVDTTALHDSSLPALLFPPLLHPACMKGASLTVPS